ncbi:TlpA disulfide reductase family protein [Alteromonas sp. KUL49]|uniref:TlpA disulfide reductase family protein n=1 Tax=Alteromonas sp. KUL49 TaxID=2480798 RepID=UPI00102EF6CA|nr:TlpA disulfide reductase family protein [Alteromonas sp. KUL49]TAP40358.1 TlpA family protein disulfide reductase [Alteromonas sp. KUL49]GEA11510.1 thiol:disulfide interchange protein [Alteromonas sp. KUL49]
MKLKSLNRTSSFALIVIFLFGVTLATSTEADEPQVNMPAPDFTLKSRDGNNLRLAEEVGNIVIVNFWASWCGPCREELPAFEALYQDYVDLGVTVLAVNVDDDSAKAQSMLADMDISFPVLYDPNGDVSELYDVSAMPTTVMIDRNGDTRLIHKGYKSGDEKQYEKAIKLLLRE